MNNAPTAPVSHLLRGHAWALVMLLAAGLGACSSGDEAGDDKAGAGAGQADASDVSSQDAGADDAAAPLGCPPGMSGCVGGDRVVCNAAGSAFEIVPCAKAEVCFEGKCAQCAQNADCDLEAGEICAEGVCGVPPLKVLTEALPTALVGTPWSAQLEAAGGVKPYKWALEQGALPDGLLMEDSGKLGGVAKVKGKASVLVGVKDASGDKATKILVVEAAEGGLLITTPSPLKKAIEGEAYSVALEAKGGDKPWFWGLVGGKLPAGLALSAAGNLAGVPSEDGAFSFDIKVLDNGTPTQVAQKSFELTVGLAPLEIVGKQQVNLLITKLIVLPLIVAVKGIPVPYNNKLEAKGGKKPYTWVEEPLPAALKTFVPNSGLPKGLTLAKDGTVSGAVTDPSQVVEVKIPLSQISLQGFFFAAKVTDSQQKAATKTAIFIIPTAPIGN